MYKNTYKPIQLYNLKEISYVLKQLPSEELETDSYTVQPEILFKQLRINGTRNKDSSFNTSDFEGTNSESLSWSVYLSVLALMSAFAFYYVVSLISYHHLANRNSRCSEEQKRLRHNRSDSCMYAKCIRMMFISSSISILFDAIIAVISAANLSAPRQVSYCNTWVIVAGTLRTMSGIQMNTILWLRQRIFYKHPVLRHLNTWFTNGVSWMLLTTMILSSAASLAIFLLTSSAKQIGETACAIIKNEVMGSLSMHASLGATIVLIVVYRIFFLGMLIYPLMKHREKLKLSCTLNNEVRLLALIKRVLLVDCMCIAVYIATTVVGEFLRGQSILLFFCVWEAELVLGLFFIILSFVDWRKRLFPYCVRNFADVSKRSK